MLGAANGPAPPAGLGAAEGRLHKANEPAQDAPCCAAVLPGLTVPKTQNCRATPQARSHKNPSQPRCPLTMRQLDAPGCPSNPFIDQSQDLPELSAPNMASSGCPAGLPITASSQGRRDPFLASSIPPSVCVCVCVCPERNGVFVALSAIHRLGEIGGGASAWDTGDGGRSAHEDRRGERLVLSDGEVTQVRGA